jgi:KipI family sensor histidine kinase inhibitor
MKDMKTSFTFQEYGDSAVLINMENDDYETRWLTAQLLGDSLRERIHDGIIDVVASYQTVFISFNSLAINHNAVFEIVKELLQAELVPRTPNHFKLPVLYGDEFGPHINQVAEICNISPDEVIEIHSSQDWVVRFIGSPIGAPMMDGPKFPVSVPRLQTPVARMEPGSVAVSGLQSIIYNAPSPGGWQVIGRTPVKLFDLEANPSMPFRAGDLIRFIPIAHSDWDNWNRMFHQVKI